MSTMVPGPSDAGRPPQEVQAGLWLFAPSRDSQGGSAWWLEQEQEQGGTGGVLIDCPGYTAANLAFLQGRAAGRIVLTSREGHGRCRRFQEALDWPVLLQEQEAYLLPGVQRVDTFAEHHQLGEQLRLLWTPGPTPGACVLLASRPAGDVLFCGRLLSPTAPGQVAPLRTARSFHWHRWLRSLGQLRTWLPAGSPDWLASGAGLGALRGEKLIAAARPLLDGLDLEALARSGVG